MLLHELVTTSAAVAATRSRNAKIALLAEPLRAASAGEVAIVTAYLSGSLRQRRTGVGWRGVLGRTDRPAIEPTLTVAEVDAAFEELAGISGTGSGVRRDRLLASLFGRATTDEQRYLAALVTGETRQGALDGLVLEAVATAFELPSDLVRRAAMFAGSTAAVAEAAASGGAAAVAVIGLSVGRPVRPMLASSAKTVAEAIAKVGGGTVAIDAKLDGIRVQVHRNSDGVRIFTRSLDDITERLPEVVAEAAALDATTLVLDGEVLALDEAGRPRPFQETAARSASQGSTVHLTAFYFDLLERDGRVLVDEPASVRLRELSEVVPSQSLVRRLVTDDPAEANAFAASVLADGQEGVVVKCLTAPYEAGRRGSSWVKVKPVHTLDLVVLAVERGSGRRRGTLSNIHLGARDPETGGFVMLGKTFKGMTDEMLAWQTKRFTELATDQDEWVVRVRPEQVVEIAFDGLQRSSRYPGGLALRFARVVRYRDDKTAAEADTIDLVRRLAGG